MKTFLLFCVLFFNIYIITAQQIIDIKADLVSVNTQSRLTFYKKVNKDTYLAINIVPKITSENKLYLTSTERSIHHSFPKKDSTTFEINGFPNTKPEDYKNDYFNRTYSKKYNIQLNNSDKDVIEILESTFNQLFTLSIFEKNNKNQDLIWKKKATNFFNYFFIRINKKKTILVFVNNANSSIVEGFLMATKTKPVLNINKYRTSKLKNFKENQLLIKEIPDSILPKNSIMDWSSVNYALDDGKIKDLISRDNHLERDFDTLYYHFEFIIGKKDSATVFYNKKLRNITPKNQRAFYLPVNRISPFYNGIQILADNDVKWLTASGKLKDELKPVYQAICGFGDMLYPTHIKISQDQNFFYLNDHQLTKTSTYDDVYFLNGTNDQFDATSTFWNFLKVRKDDKWGIISFNMNSNEPAKVYQSTNVLAVNYDEIELIDAFIRLKKDGLFGYFQINDKPKYTSLGKFNNYFARFTLPNGQNGWLTKDGIEYLDE